MGGFAERVLLLSRSCDVLLTRGPWALSDGPILAGVDGSEESYLALRKAVELAKQCATWVGAVAVYDPFFHTGVFGSISTAITAEQAGRFNFAAQQRLHDEIIDDGLRQLYLDRVKKGAEGLRDAGVRIEIEVLTGKVYPRLCQRAKEIDASLIVVGRHGIHREKVSPIGSNAHALARIASANVLIVGTEPGQSAGQAAAQVPAERPPVAPPAAGSDPFKGGGPSGENEAELVVLKKAKALAPSFHTHIARSRIVGSSVQVGERYMVFDVVETRPSGRVRVTERTRVEFV